MHTPLGTAGQVLQQKGEHTPTHTVSPDTQVFDAVDLINQHPIGSLVVEKTIRSSASSPNGMC